MRTLPRGHPPQRCRDHRAAQSSQRVPDPSAEDVYVTRQIVEAGKLLGIDCLDHIVVGANRFCSLKERDLGF